MKMNVQRAKEILESPDIIPVTCNGKQIIIQSVNEKNETARIYLREEPMEEKTVSVHELVEEQ
jgi:small acid-soluble spore protein H (minor)